MKYIVLIIVLILESLLAHKDWWQTGQFYQIYPRSFKDSNGDGIGDLNGITEKLPHLKDIGITAAWLSPIFRSPMKDFGYDISDYKAIQPEYGTMTDFDRLLKTATELGIKIILDLVPNHSSDEHEWFKKSVNRESGYEDFYVWHSGKPDPKNSTNRLPPNNWISVFRGSAWKWNTQRKQFYLHQFVEGQPDLNYRNEKVVEAMKDVLKFWLDKGVAGFRVDAVPVIFEVPVDNTGNYPDEPVSGATNDTDDRAYLRHIYTEDQPETFALVYRARKFLDEYQKQNGGDTRIFLVETYSPIDVVMQYYGNGTHNGAHLPFNFNFITRLNNSSRALDYMNAIAMWLDNMPDEYTPNWVLGNHDQRRVGSRMGSYMIDSLNMLIMMLPGASVTYNGEEIGMLDVDISWNDTVDPAACNSNPQIYQKFTRDPARTPFQWDDSKNAGFSTSNKTWLPVSSNYKEVNVKVENQLFESHLKTFKESIALRKSKTLQYGVLIYEAINTNVLAVLRAYEQKIMLLVINLSPLPQNVDLRQFARKSPMQMKFKLVNSRTSRNKVGAVLRTPRIKMNPYESFILGTD